MLILLDSLHKFERPKITPIITKWLECSKDVKRNKITLILETIILSDPIRQSDDHSCASLVCLSSYIARILSMNYVTIND